MESLKDLFDEYSRSTRLQPGLLVLFPALVAVLVWFPSVYGFGGTLLGLAITCGLFAFLVNLTRSRGRAAEKKLFTMWGGKPTTAWLRHSNTNLNAHTKGRYHAFLASKVTSWVAPTPEEETRDAASSDSLYESAVVWLLEYSRDRKRFPLVFKENVVYGFRRNLYGMKPVGIVVTVLTIAANALGLYLQYGSATAIEWFSLSTALIFLGLWVFIVRPDWVKDAGEGHARALLACCQEV